MKKCLTCEDALKEKWYKVIFPIPPSLWVGYERVWQITNGYACEEHFEELRQQQYDEGVLEDASK